MYLVTQCIWKGCIKIAVLAPVILSVPAAGKACYHFRSSCIFSITSSLVGTLIKNMVVGYPFLFQVVLEYLPNLWQDGVLSFRHKIVQQILYLDKVLILGSILFFVIISSVSSMVSEVQVSDLGVSCGSVIPRKLTQTNSLPPPGRLYHLQKHTWLLICPQWSLWWYFLILTVWKRPESLLCLVPSLVSKKENWVLFPACLVWFFPPSVRVSVLVSFLSWSSPSIDDQCTQWIQAPLDFLKISVHTWMK